MNTLGTRNWTPPDGYDQWPVGKIPLTSDEARRYLGVQPERLRQWLARGHIERMGADYDMGTILNYMWDRQIAGALDT